MSTSLTCTAQGPVRASLEAAKVVCDKLGNTCTGIRKSEFTRHEIRACKSEKNSKLEAKKAVLEAKRPLLEFKREGDIFIC